MYEYKRSYPGYFQGMGDIIAIFFIEFFEYYKGELTIENYNNCEKEILDIIESASYILTIYLMQNIHISKNDQNLSELHSEIVWNQLLKELEMKNNGKFDIETEMTIKQQTYKFLICFFARELQPHYCAVIYDCLICGTLSNQHNAFEGLVKLILAFLTILKNEHGVNFSSLFEFNTANKKYFENITEEEISHLIMTSWNE